MPIFGQYQGGDAFNVSQNMDAVLKQQQATAEAMMNVGPAIQKTKEEMDVLRATTSQILSQYSTDESGKPSDAAPKYIHDLYKSINKEGGLGYLSRSQLISTLEGYKTGMAVEEQVLNTRAKQQQLQSGELQLKKAQAEWDEYQKIVIAHKLAMETAGSGTGSPKAIIDSVAKFEGTPSTSASPTPVPASVANAPITPAPPAPVGVARTSKPSTPTAPSSATPQSKTLEYRVPTSKEAEVKALERERLTALLEAKKAELYEIGKVQANWSDLISRDPNALSIPNNPLNTSYGFNPQNPITQAAQYAWNATFGEEKPSDKAKRIEAEQARIVDNENKRTQLTAEIAEIGQKLKSFPSSDSETVSKQEAPKPVGATPVPAPKATVQDELDKANTYLSTIKSSAPMKPDDALKDGNIGKIHAEFVKQTGRALYTGSPLWSRKDIIKDNRFDSISSTLTDQYLKDTGVDVVKLDSEGKLSQDIKDDFYEWADYNSKEGKLETLQAFAKSNYDDWKYKFDNAEAQVKLLSNAVAREKASAKTAPASPTAPSTPIPASIAPAGSTSAPIQAQTPRIAERPIPPVTNQPELKSDDEKITEEYGQLTSRLRSLDKLPMNWSEETFRQMRGYPPKIRVVSSNGIKLVGIGGKWEVLQDKGNQPSVTDMIAIKKQAILESAIRVDGLSGEKFRFSGDIRTTEANEAGKVKESVLNVTRAITAIDRLLELGQTGVWDSLTPNDKSGAIEAITNAVQAAGRTEIAGSGAFSEEDAKKLASIVPSLASLSGAIFREQSLAKLGEYRSRMLKKAIDIGNAWGFEVSESASSGLTKEQEAIVRLRYQEYMKQGASHEQAKQAALADVLNK